MNHTTRPPSQADGCKRAKMAATILNSAKILYFLVFLPSVLLPVSFNLTLMQLEHKFYHTSIYFTNIRFLDITNDQTCRTPLEDQLLSGENMGSSASVFHLKILHNLWIFRLILGHYCHQLKLLTPICDPEDQAKETHITVYHHRLIAKFTAEKNYCFFVLAI